MARPTYLQLPTSMEIKICLPSLDLPVNARAGLDQELVRDHDVFKKAKGKATNQGMELEPCRL